CVGQLANRLCQRLDRLVETGASGTREETAEEGLRHTARGGEAAASHLDQRRALRGDVRPIRRRRNALQTPPVDWRTIRVGDGHPRELRRHAVSQEERVGAGWVA